MGKRGKSINEVLQESESLLISTLSAMDDAVFVLDQNGRFAHYHAPASVKLYVSPMKFIGKKCTEVMPPHFNKLFSKAFKKNQDGKVDEFEYWLEKNNETRWYSAKLSPIFKNSKFLGSVAVARDISEKKKAEEEIKKSKARLHHLLVSSPAAIYSAKASGDYPATFVSDNVKGITGYESKNFINNPKFWVNHVHPDDLPIVFKEVAILFKRNQHGYMYRFRCKDGNYVWVYDHMTLLRDEKGKPLEIVGYWADVTKQKKAEQALKNSKKLIEKEVKRKTKELKEAHEKIKDYAEKLHLKIKRIDEKRVPLTNKEKLAFYGLVRYPGLTSKEIAEKLGMKAATVNSIKNRLKKEGYFTTMYIPRLDMLGCSLLSVNYGVGDTDIDNDKLLTPKMKEEIFRQFISIPEKVYFVSSGKEAFSLDIAKDWSDYKNMQDSIEEGIQKKGIKLNSYETVLFPLDKSVFHNYFDFTGILRGRFGLDIADSKEPEPEHKKYELSRTEKKLTYGLIMHPELTVAELSKTIKLSVPTICKFRKKLVEEGMLKIVNFPDFAKIGMELIVLSCSKSTPSAEGSENKGCKNNPNAFFSIMTRTDCVSISAYEDYTQAKTKMNKYPCGNTGGVKDQSNILIPLEKIKFPKLEFAPLVKKIFNLDVKF